MQNCLSCSVGIVIVSGEKKRYINYFIVGLHRLSFRTVKCEYIFWIMKVQHLERVNIRKFKPYDCIFSYPETIKVIIEIVSLLKNISIPNLELVHT